MLRDLTFAFVGAGTMGEAMIAGLLQKQLVSPDRILATTPRAERREALAARHGIRTSADNRAAAAEADVVVLAFKPQVLPQVLPTLRGAVSPEATVISILAGVTLASFREGLGHAAIVRALPNTPAQIGEGMTVWTATPEVTQEQRDEAAAMLGALGRELYVADEKYIDMGAELSGTIPAYCFLVLESLVDAGVHLGFSRRMAEELVFQAMHGSVLLAMQSGQHLAELRNRVTSPGGASAAALYAMEKGGLRTAMADGVWASYRRIQELGNEDPAPRTGPGKG